MKKEEKYQPFEEIFRKKLENLEVPVDLPDWDAIHKRLPQKKSGRKKIIGLWSTVAAAACIAIILTIMLPGEKGNSVQYLKNQKTAKIAEKKSLPEENISTLPETASYAPLSRKMPETKKQLTATRENTSSEAPEIKEIRDSISTSGKVSDTAKDKNTEEQPQKVRQEEKNKNLFLAEMNNYPVKKKEKKKEWLLAAAVGTHGNSADFYNNGLQSEMMYFSPSMASFPNSEKNDLIIPEDIKGKHLPPLSFGLTIRKYFNNRFGVETGLVYTYLSSEYEWENGARYDATQQLHYLGIPLNGIVSIWNNHSQWDVYLSAGVMLEKGLRMKSVRNQYFKDYMLTNTEKNNIDGQQWSLNGSLGISYRIYKDMRLYVEPRIGYYFNDNQPLSIRTEEPVSIGIGAGLQYVF